MHSVIIVGGGSAGWMTASYLSAAFGDRIALSVVESDRVPIVGVGEATFSTIRDFFSYLGLAETDWMPACAATYKLGIRFENWRRPGYNFYHPFERVSNLQGFPLTEWWLRMGTSDQFDHDCFVLSALCDSYRAPRYLDGRHFDGRHLEGRHLEGRHSGTTDSVQFPYAYHFDATLVARFLAGYATKRGVRHVVDDVTGFRQDEEGTILAACTRKSGDLRADLFIDCTGFRGLLINQTLSEPFLSFRDTLPNDRAVAFRVPKEPDRDHLAPYTRATALEAGWAWTIPLFGRDGVGYVYDSSHSSPEEAEGRLREFIGTAAVGLEANHLAMRIGRCRRSWVKNCVAIGLSSGFVEPLESTGIFFIHHAVEQLVSHFPGETRGHQMIDHYNDVVAHAFDGVREFLVLHYQAAARTDNEYWRSAKRADALPDLWERLALWGHALPAFDSIFPYFHGFEPYNYACMLIGLGGVPLQARPPVLLMEKGLAAAEFARIRHDSTVLSRSLPSHSEYVAHLNA